MSTLSQGTQFTPNVLSGNPIVGMGVPVQERLTLQAEAGGIVNAILAAHERLDRLTSGPQQGQTPSNAALPSLSESLSVAAGELGRLNQRLDMLCERVGQV